MVRARTIQPWNEFEPKNLHLPERTSQNVCYYNLFCGNQYNQGNLCSFYAPWEYYEINHNRLSLFKGMKTFLFSFDIRVCSLRKGGHVTDGVGRREGGGGVCRQVTTSSSLKRTSLSALSRYSRHMGVVTHCRASADLERVRPC